MIAALRVLWRLLFYRPLILVVLVLVYAVAALLLATVDPVLRASAWPDLVAVGAVLVVTANAGDLLLSRLKRSAGLKDFGRLLPGHGGVLDRFDGWLVSTPVLFVLVSILPVLVARR